MTSERPRKTEQQPKGELKGNLGIKEAQLEKEKDSTVSHMVKKPSRLIKDRSDPATDDCLKRATGARFGRVRN
jgi:hypothetical protein